MAHSGSYPNLAKAVTVGAITAKNRVWMASLTRNRSIPTTYVNEDNIKYYRQRARNGGAGLILTEGTLISQQGTEWPHAPGIWSEEHAKAWKTAVDAVHEEGTPIVAQLWHVGRVSHPDMEEQKAAGTPVWAPSAVSARGGKFRDLPGAPGYVTPTAIEDPTTLLDQYSNAAKMAKQAGFDGVELHSANGYLQDQFLSDVSNIRTDKWGGSRENRIRFTLESAKRLIEVYGADRVGIKLTPNGGYNDMYHSTPEERIATFHLLIQELDKLGLAYMQIAQYNAYGDPKHDGKPQGVDFDVVKEFKGDVKNSNLVTNTGYDADRAEKEVADGNVVAVVFGQAFISNPDYYRRAQEKLGFNQADPTSFYGSADGVNGHGYWDYPAVEA